MKRLSKVLLITLLAVTMLLLSAGSAGAATRAYLGAADSFAVLAYSAVTNTGNSVITGNLGLTPTDGGSITGFYSPGVVNGTIYTVNAAGPAGYEMNPTLLDTAKSAQTAAYLDLAGRTPWTDLVGLVVPGDNQLGGRTLPPGVYRFPAATTANLTAANPLILDGTGYPESERVWIFQATSTLVTGPGSSVVLVNATPCDVFWQVSSSATIDTTTNFVGNILALASVTLNTNANLLGSAHALNGAVTLDDNDITKGPCALAPPVETLLNTGMSKNTNMIPWNMIAIVGLSIFGLICGLFLFKSTRAKKETS